MNYLFYGTLRDQQVLSVVAGQNILRKWQRSIVLHDFQCFYVENESFPALLASPKDQAQVDLYANLTAQEIDSIASFEGDQYKTKVLRYDQSEYNYFDFIDKGLVSHRVWTLSAFRSSDKPHYLRAIKSWKDSGIWPI